jgi:hypothetical protein
MEQILPPKTRDGAGFELTRVCQFTVFLENRVGRLHNLVRAMEEAGLKLWAIAIEESAEAALVRMICNLPEGARTVLKHEGFCFSESDVLIVPLSVKTSFPIGSVCATVLAGELNIHYAYPMLTSPRGPALVLYVDDCTLAAQLLIKKGFMLVAENELKPSS